MPGTMATATTIAIFLRQRSAEPQLRQLFLGPFRSAPATDILPMAKLTRN
jgi:hypothetical protein